VDDQTAKIHSKIVDWELFKDGACLQILTYLIVKARKTDTSFKGHRIARGEVRVGLRELMAACGETEARIKTRIGWMIDGRYITVRKIKSDGRNYGIIKLVNYNKHQTDVTPKSTATATAKTKAGNAEIRKQFVKPTVEEVAEYIKQRVAEGKPEVCADTFWHFYESKGWRVGNQPMKDWHCAIVTWEGKERSQTGAGQGGYFDD
jgi:hypothetical protein